MEYHICSIQTLITKLWEQRYLVIAEKKIHRQTLKNPTRNKKQEKFHQEILLLEDTVEWMGYFKIQCRKLEYTEYKKEFVEYLEKESKNERNPEWLRKKLTKLKKSLFENK